MMCKTEGAWARAAAFLAYVGLGILSPSVQAQSTTAPYEPDSLTVLLYHCDEPGGSLVIDATGNGFTGAAVNVVREPSARFEGGLRLAGDGHVDVAFQWQSSLPSSAELTYEAWIYRTSSVEAMIVTSLGTSIPWGDGRALGIDADGRLFARAVRSHEGGYTAQGNTPVPLHEWTHVAAVFDPFHNRMAVYRNGTLDGEGLLEHGYSGSNEIRVGDSHWGGEGFVGVLDEIRISATVRTFVPVAVEAKSWDALKSRYRTTTSRTP